MRECALLGRDEERRINREQAATTLANLKAKGMAVNEITPAEMQRIRDKTRVVYEQHGKAIGDEAMTLVFGELKRIRGN
jgi:TRAP-type C4-dicarboxylate transport system substrate-binding protein